MTANILLIEGKRASHTSFSQGLIKKGFRVESVPNGSAAMARLENIDPDLVVVDAASLRSSGKRICESIHHKLDHLPIILILETGQPAPDGKTGEIVLQLPFTIQKLVNRIKAVLPPPEKDLLHVGPVRLNLQQRQVRCLGKQAKLTPRLVMLLQILMEKPGQVVEREELFIKAWDTTYTEDTRTLDVHMSWLRKAIEPDPAHPRLIITVRGVGYRLDV